MFIAELYADPKMKHLVFIEVYDRVHRVLEKSLKVPEFWQENSRPLKVLENRVGPRKSLNLNVPYFEIFAY